MSFNYWRGQMGWNIDSDWKCEICKHDHTSLIWGMVNGECRCDVCHTIYYMKDEKGNPITTPAWCLRPEYQNAARLWWEEKHIPINELEDSDWDEYIEKASNLDLFACPQCRHDLSESDRKEIDSDNFDVEITCDKCGIKSKWYMDAPVPLLIPDGVNE